MTCEFTWIADHFPLFGGTSVPTVSTRTVASVGIDAIGGGDPRRPSDFTVVGAAGDFLRAGSDGTRELGCGDELPVFQRQRL
jgi:hypothetical protein